MNEKIKLLAEQATTIVGVEHCRAFDREVIDQEKFAELIVKECAQVCIRVGDCNNDIAPEFGQGAYFSAEQIKEHFGVEE